MKRFVRGFVGKSMRKISDEINEFSENNNHEIISINSVIDAESGYISVIVLFEKIEETEGVVYIKKEGSGYEFGE